LYGTARSAAECYCCYYYFLIRRLIHPVVSADENNAVRREKLTTRTNRFPPPERTFSGGPALHPIHIDRPAGRGRPSGFIFNDQESVFARGRYATRVLQRPPRTTRVLRCVLMNPLYSFYNVFFDSTLPSLCDRGSRARLFPETRHDISRSTPYNNRRSRVRETVVTT